MNIIQIILIVSLLFALSRVFLRLRDHKVSVAEFGFWAILFSGAITVVVFPNETTHFAQFLGIGRGVDLIVYASIVTLFYLMFRAYVLMEDIRHEITELVRKIALQDKK
ncbi:DUF2304 family protein [Patescibacteria group bacterium]|nr:DUF2304 family protein [Patescibacteria group bacterium]